ncbi:formimidoylglutamase [Gilvimarinus agarilyticus]|uniref:formimidoylglutamase n=1 Tax=Reichenbachiella agariperforans TaxID=156994 RepID=UPI001C09B635|nr:formimidoylglutamase [Reichenbachiella agariperforans]MBU2885840.1 formimidoylglutamase [Gilvimarinus agarilyticus]MBU2915223.1 formimidoylglutamase [Reichenbachiella agariperforans]
MDLKLFFNPIDASLKSEQFDSDSLIQSIYINESKIPSLESIDIAIIGLSETSGSESIADSGLKHIRQKLYGLKKGQGSCNIVDLGNLRNGTELEETYKRIQVVCQRLIEKRILPILIGGSHDLDIGQYLAYQEEEKMVSVLNIDSRFDITNKQEQAPNLSHFHKIFTHEPNYLFNFTQLGHQSYLVNPSAEQVLTQLGFHSLRLGAMRDDFRRVEPLIREADMISFDLSAIQKIYCPGGDQSVIFGLTGEEACQIMWYAGMNDKLSSVGIYEYNHEKDTSDHQSAMIVATMVWYFIEGFKNRKGEKGFQTNDYVKYVVALDVNPETIVFYKSRLSDKWWMEVPNMNHTGVYDRNYIIPCDHSDYELATKGEIPERWIQIFSKL